MPVTARRSFLVAASPAELWPLVSNTDRFNKQAGFPAMEVEGVDGDFVKRVRARLFGLRLAWRELPFEWAEGRHFRAVREFSAGPFARFEGGLELRPQAGGTSVDIDVAVTPRNALGWALARWVVAPRTLAAAARMLAGYEAELRARAGGAKTKRGWTAGDRAALAQRAAALQAAPVDRAAADRLIGHLLDGYDDEITRMRPYALADRWGLDRAAVLRMMLHAVKRGLLDLRWEVLCPNCSGADAHRSLAEIKGGAHCPGCDIDFGVKLDESVEVRFSANAGVRRVDERAYCVSNPAGTPFAAGQWLLLPGQARELELSLACETYALRHLKAKRRVILRPSSSGRDALRVDLAAAAADAELPFRAGTVRLSLQPDPAATALLRLERESWKDGGATAASVTALQEFRDLFSSELLAPGVEIAVRNAAFLFTDLKDSTALYRRIGDATAYALVRDHFDYLYEIVGKYQGAVVKTIGDAIMAVFPSGGRAVAAALDMQFELARLNRKLSPRPPVVLKIGVHEGPSIAITQNERLDYFGTTINVAARVQSESRGGDIVLTEPLRREPAVERLLASRPLAEESFAIPLRGLSEVYQLYRLSPKGNGHG